MVLVHAAMSLSDFFNTKIVFSFKCLLQFTRFAPAEQGCGVDAQLGSCPGKVAVALLQQTAGKLYALTFIKARRRGVIGGRRGGIARCGVGRGIALGKGGYGGLLCRLLYVRLWEDGCSRYVVVG